MLVGDKAGRERGKQEDQAEEPAGNQGSRQLQTVETIGDKHQRKQESECDIRMEYHM